MRIQTSASKDLSPFDLEQQFRVYLHSYCKLAEQWGFNLVPYSPLTWMKFRTLSASCQVDVFEKFKTYYSICTSAAESGVALRDSRSLVWHALKSLKFRPSHDLLDKIQENDVVEIYNIDNIQVFRNLRFFEISGYSLGDIFTHTWQELYVRDPNDIQSIVGAIEDCYSKPGQVVPSTNMKKHTLVEAFSQFGHSMDLKFKFFSSIFHKETSSIAGFLCTCTVDVVDKKMRPEPLAFEDYSNVISIR